MDLPKLQEDGFETSEIDRVELRDYQLCIGNRAGLIKKPGDVTYGLLAAMPFSDLARLYAAPGLEAYLPIRVNVHSLDSIKVYRADCYNIAPTAIGTKPNRNDADALANLLQSLGFPEPYTSRLRLL